MKSVTPYLFFDGNCREAMEFYQGCLGGDLQVMTYGDAQGDSCPLALKDRVMHASVGSGDWILMASDAPDRMPPVGGNVQVTADCSSRQEIEALFDALSQGGTPTYPLHDAFWGGVFGTLTDRYGVNWMLNFEAGGTA